MRVEGKVKQKVIKYLGAVEPVVKKKKKQGRKNSIFVRELTTEESEALGKASRNANSFKKDRAKIILLSAQGKSVNDICKSLNKDRKTVARAIKGFNEQGLQVLIRKKAKGANPKFTKEHRAKILELILTEPRRLKLHFTTWSLPKLRAYIVRNRIVKSICIESIRRILQAQGVRLTPSKRWQYSNDPNFLKKTLDR